MTIKDYVLKQDNMGINEWLSIINKDGLTHYEKIILECANDYNKININHKAKFENTINF